MKNKNGFTLIEILVSFLVGAILILMIGVVSGISHSSFQKVRKEAEIFDDIAYGYKLLRNRIREAENISSDTPDGTDWIGSRLITDNGSLGIGSFGVYQSPNQMDFVYLPDWSDANNRQVLLSVPISGDNALAFTFTEDGSTVNCSIVGKKDKILFNVDSIIAKRIE